MSLLQSGLISRFRQSLRVTIVWVSDFELGIFFDLTAAINPAAVNTPQSLIPFSLQT